jgi:hypothetical protein
VTYPNHCKSQTVGGELTVTATFDYTTKFGRDSVINRTLGMTRVADKRSPTRKLYVLLVT